MCLALPAQVVEILPNDEAKVNLSGVTKQISVALVDDLAVGDYVIVHVGYALSKVDEEEAKATLALFEESQGAVS